MFVIPKIDKKYRPDFPDDHKKKKTKTLDIFAEIRYNICKESIPIGGRSQVVSYENNRHLLGSQGRLFPFIIENHVQK